MDKMSVIVEKVQRLGDLEETVLHLQQAHLLQPLFTKL